MRTEQEIRNQIDLINLQDEELKEQMNRIYSGHELATNGVLSELHFQRARLKGKYKALVWVLEIVNDLNY